MTSRLRGPSAVKDTPRAASFAKDLVHRNEPEVHSGRSCKNGERGNRYHFGMSKQHDNKIERNGREYNKNAQTEENNADLLYKKSRQHFGSWDIKNIVQDDTRKSKKQDLEDTQLTNGKFRTEPVSAKLDKSHDRPEYRDEGYVGSLPRDSRQRGESVEREPNGSHKSRIRESWEEEVESRNRGRRSKISRNNDSTQPVDERDILLKEIENLATDGSQSPDRRIQAMIERLKSREETKLRSKREQRSASSEKEGHSTAKSDGRSDLRSPIIDHPLDNLSNDRGRKLKDDGDEPRRPSESKLRGKPDREVDASRRDRSTDRKSRSTERRNETREPRRDDSFRKTSDTYNTERNYRRRSIEDEHNHPRSRDNSSKRRSYTYEGSPENFDIRIQRYDRAIVEPRRDLDRNSPRRGSPRRNSFREPNLVKKESLKECDREPIIKKNSFKAESKRATSKDRGESNLNRRTSFKDQDNDEDQNNSYKRHLSKNQHETSSRYFGKDQEDACQDPFKDVNADINKKGFLKMRDSDFNRTFLKDQNDNAERKVSSMEQAGGVSRIILRNIDDESNKNNSFKNVNEDFGKKNSFKEKNAELCEISYKDRESNSERRKNSFKGDDKEFGRTSYHDYENNIDRKTANNRYIEFGKISFKTEDDELNISSPFKEDDNEAVVRTNSFKEHDTSSKRRTSLGNRDHEVKKSDRANLRALSPLKKDELESNARDSKDFCAKSWYESNRMFSAKYLRDHSKLRSTPEGRLDVEVSPDRGFSILQDTRGSTVDTSTNDPEENRFETRGKIDSGNSESPRFSSTRDRNGATIIRIRSSEDPGSAAERRRRRRPAQEICAMRRRKYEDDDEDSDEDEEEDRWRRTRRDGGILPGRGGSDASGATPSRTVWNYREGVWHFHESIAFDRSFMVQRREAIFINRWRR